MAVAVKDSKHTGACDPVSKSVLFDEYGVLILPFESAVPNVSEASCLQTPSRNLSKRAKIAGQFESGDMAVKTRSAPYTAQLGESAAPVWTPAHSAVVAKMSAYQTVWGLAAETVSLQALEPVGLACSLQTPLYRRVAVQHVCRGVNQQIQPVTGFLPALLRPLKITLVH